MSLESSLKSIEKHEQYLVYIEKFEDRIGQASDDEEYQTLYYRSHLLISNGLYKEAVVLLQKAYEFASKVKNDYIWSSLYYNICHLYAATLDYLGDVKHAEELFIELLELNQNGIHLGDYAIFLHKRKRDYNNAHNYYIKALQLYPNQSSIHLKYAGFLRHIKNDLIGTETHYKLAIETNPDNSDALGSYASFLHGVLKKIDLAEQFYAKSIQIDGTHANNLCNYGLFLSEEKKQYDKAEEMYKQSIEVSPRHANSLYNYAVMLDTRCNRKSEAESYYRRCLDEEPRHSFALYNLAVLLEEKYTLWEQENDQVDAQQRVVFEKDRKKKRQEVCLLYKRTVDVDDKDSVVLADFGRYLSSKCEDYETAEPILRRAIDLNPSNQVALYHSGILHHRRPGSKRNLNQSEIMFRKLLDVNRNHGAGIQQLARVLVDIFKDGGQSTSSKTSVKSDFVPASPFDEAMDMYERAITVVKDPGTVSMEYVKVVTSYGSNRQKLRAISVMDDVLKTKNLIKGTEIKQILESAKVNLKA